jgi:hypothetical protein
MTLPIVLALMDLVSVAPAIGLGYYAIRMLFLSRRGRLENGWRLVTFGGIMFLIGFLSLTLQDLTFAYTMPYYVTDVIGTTFSFTGLTLFMLGFRSHYSVWSLKGFIKKPKDREIPLNLGNIGPDSTGVTKATKKA